MRNSAAMAMVLALTVPALLVPAPAAALVFSNVRIEGAERIEPETILSYTNIARGENVSAGQLNDATQRLMNSGLFESAEVVPQGSTLVVRVREYPTINVISFEGNRRAKDSELEKIVKSQARRVYSPATAEADAQEISKYYAAQGRLAARVDPRIIRRDGNRVDLVFEVREGDVTEIERIGFTGNRAFSDRRLRNVLSTKQAGILRTFIRSDTFAAERIPLDERLLTDFYRSRGYADFQVQAVSPELTRERDAFYVTFQIQEGPRYTFGKVDTISQIPGLDASVYGAENRVRSGEVYNPAAIDNSIRRMENLAIRQGQDFVRIEPQITRNMRDQTLDLTYVISRGPRVFIERIDIEGNTSTLDRVIRREFSSVEGDPFNPREIRNSAERIRALGYFADAQVETRQGTSPQDVIVDVNVEEQPTGSLSFGASYGVNSGVGLNVGLQERNFMGRGQELSFSISTASSNQNSGFTFVEPYFLGRNVRFRTSLWYNTTDSENADFNTRSLGGLLGLEFPISENGRLELRYRLAKDTIKDVADDTSRIIASEEGSYVSSALGYSYSWDSRRRGLEDPTVYKFSFGQDFAGVGGDVESVKTSVLAGVQSTAWRDDVTLSAEVEGGAVHMLGDDPSRITDRFMNGSRIRGFEPDGIGPRDFASANSDAVGGNFFWVARAEARFPVGLPEEYGIQGGVFADAGSVWGLDSATRAVAGADVGDSYKMNVRASVGVSMFWDTPIGPLRLNYAKAVKKMDYDEEQQFDVTISTRF
ncbi:MAG: outer membrane protein assembly factor BamA [Paracoccus sp. (in: a-proteobacteria)]|nr:outer membrane protein assembly factor BamA [Paracoccus sp. (in: a-proteobacteria)]MDO5622392.1 outer membrane protein assembly factor BamA [Paracoccus sp. (in: a-proteobacteria)]